MQMNMVNALASMSSVVDYDSVTIFEALLRSNFGANNHEMTEYTTVIFSCIAVHTQPLFVLWDHQEMYFGLGVHVSEGQTMGVFK